MESSTLCLPKMSKRQSAFGLSFLHNSCRYLFFSRQCWQLWLKTSWIPLESITSRKRDCRRCFWVEKPKDHPQPHPPRKKSQIHRIPHVSIEPHHHEFLRRSHRRGRSAACPSKIPHASQRHAEPEHREHRCNPTPSQRAGLAGLKSQPRWQQPEPQGKKRATHHQRGDRRDPTRTAIRMPHAPCLCIDRKRLTNTPVLQAGSVLKCPDDRKNRVVSAQATYASGS